ncbi:MAG: hypothetical protein ACXACB_10410, partial [Promethearchaeota archaeon]
MPLFGRKDKAAIPIPTGSTPFYDLDDIVTLRSYSNSKQFVIVGRGTSMDADGVISIEYDVLDENGGQIRVDQSEVYSKVGERTFAGYKDEYISLTPKYSRDNTSVRPTAYQYQQN